MQYVFKILTLRQFHSALGSFFEESFTDIGVRSNCPVQIEET